MDIEAQTNLLTSPERGGKPSIVSKYCATAGTRNCLWFCYLEHGRVRAKDVPIGDDDAASFNLGSLLEHCGWWRRLSMYSVVKIEEVEIEFIRVTADNKIYAFPSPVQHASEVQQIDEKIGRLRDMIDTPGICGISSTGGLHGVKEECPNAIYDEERRPSCPVREIYQQKCLRDRIRNAPAALQFYWAIRKSPVPVKALRDAGYIYTYDLRNLYFYDAIKPYGQSIRAIHLVMGWCWTYIIVLVAIGLFLSMAVTVLTALASHDLNCGWAAGSYSVAIFSIFLTLFSFLSGIW